MNTITREQAIAGSPDDKYLYLDQLLIPHPALTTISSAVQRAMTPSSGIILVVGPSGVGKTTFAKIFIKTLLTRYHSELEEDPDCIPAALVPIPPHDSGKEFNFVLFYQHGCRALLAPCPTRDARTPLIGYDEERSTRCIFENALQRRKVRHLILDEAAHFTQSGTEAVKYGNLLKGFADRANMNVLLLGAFGSEEVVDSTGQLARRVLVEPFPRYHDTPDDRKAFGQAVKSYADKIPLPDPPDLKPHIRELFTTSCGAFGTAADIIKRSVRLCAIDGDRWTYEHLRESCPSQEAQAVMGAEIIDGEERLRHYLRFRHSPQYKTEADFNAERIKRHAQGQQAKNGRRGGR